ASGSSSRRFSLRIARLMTCQVMASDRALSTSRIQREVSQVHGQTGSNQKSTGRPVTASCSVAGTLTAVDVEDRAGYERGVLKINHRVDDVAHLAHATHRVQAVEHLVVLLEVHGSLDDAGGNGVDTDAASGVLDGERLGCGLEASLCQGCKHRGHVGVGVVNEGAGDVDDVAASQLEHLRD